MSVEGWRVILSSVATPGKMSKAVEVFETPFVTNLKVMK